MIFVEVLSWILIFSVTNKFTLSSEECLDVLHMYKVKDINAEIHHMKQEKSLLHWNSQNI